jgi:seryl-tRNA synthetase
MLDVKWIRENPAAFDEALKRRGLAPLASEVQALDQRRRAAQTHAQKVQAEHNQLSRDIGVAKAKGQDAGPLMQKVSELKARQAALEAQMEAADAELDRFLAVVPNAPAPDVPNGTSSDDNVVLRRSGPIAQPDFSPKQHFELGEALGLMDFEQAGVISGARFTILKGALARMERALGQFMLDLHTSEFGYTEVSPPLLVRDKTLYGTANLPKFKDDLFRTTNVEISVPANRVEQQPDGSLWFKDPQEREIFEELAKEGQAKLVVNTEGQTRRAIVRDDRRWLIPTAEVPLTNLVAGKLLNESDLPLRFTAWTPCFRSEAGAAGKDTRGMLRQHQFYKVELVSIAHPDRSEDEHERMTACAEEVLKRLELPYRTVVLCTGDMGFASRKTYDIEVWLPGQGLYREISSCSNCGDFQARRMDARFRPAGQKGTRFVHTLNGSGIAVGRALIAIMENYQRANGSIEVPAALRPYMGGVGVIGGDG